MSIRVLFICHGNICRSTMAESVFTHKVKMLGLSDQFLIDSFATSTEEIGNPPHRGTVKKLQEMDIPLVPHRARQITWEDYKNFDYIIGISIGSIAAEMTLNNDINFYEGVFAISIYAIFSYLITLLTNKSIISRRLLIGSPTVIIENGKLNYNSLKKSKLDLNDFLQEARIQGYFNLSEIEYAIMEANGQVSFLPKSNVQPVKRKDLKLKTSYEGLCCNAVIDGKIMINNLKEIGKDEEWLLTRLKNNHYNDIDSLALVILDSKENMTVFEKNMEREVKVLE